MEIKSTILTLTQLNQLLVVIKSILKSGGTIDLLVQLTDTDKLHFKTEIQKGVLVTDLFVCVGQLVGLIEHRRYDNTDYLLHRLSITLESVLKDKSQLLVEMGVQ